MTRPTLDHVGVAPAGFRLPAATGIGRVRLQVSDLSRSRAFYERVLGMRVLAEGNGRLDLGPQGDDRVLVELHERSGARPVPRRGSIGLYHFAILLPSRAALGRFVRHVTTGIAGHVGMADHLVSEALYLSDPDGLGIEVYADRPRDAWQVDSHRQLRMATDPLDVPSLVSVSGDEPWTGLPAGTVMGHVHLHVGDLERAAAFYHRALGFDKMVWTYPGALFLSAGGYHHHLGTNTWSNGAPASDDQARLLSWDIEVPAGGAAKSAAESIAAAGYDAHTRDGGWELADPWGTRVRIVEVASRTPASS